MQREQWSGSTVSPPTAVRAKDNSPAAIAEASAALDTARVNRATFQRDRAQRASPASPASPTAFLFTPTSDDARANLARAEAGAKHGLAEHMKAARSLDSDLATAAPAATRSLDSELADARPAHTHSQMFMQHAAASLQTILKAQDVNSGRTYEDTVIEGLFSARMGVRIVPVSGMTVLFVIQIANAPEQLAYIKDDENVTIETSARGASHEFTTTQSFQFQDLRNNLHDVLYGQLQNAVSGGTVSSHAR
jgi:hypothetical protein